MQSAPHYLSDLMQDMSFKVKATELMEGLQLELDTNSSGLITP